MSLRVAWQTAGGDETRRIENAVNFDRLESS
jgi:hypothetical protein